MNTPLHGGALTYEDLPSDEKLAADEAGMTYRLLYWRIWLLYLGTLDRYSDALAQIAVLEAAVKKP